MVDVQFALGAKVNIASEDDVRSAVNDGIGSLAGMFDSGHRGYSKFAQSVTVPSGTGRYVFPLANGAPTERVYRLVRAGVVVYDPTAGTFEPLSAGQTLDLYEGLSPQQDGTALSELPMATNFVGRFDPAHMSVDPATPFPLLTGSGLYAVLDVTTQFAANAVQVTVNATLQEVSASALLSALA